jgi:hypothetical protein
LREEHRLRLSEEKVLRYMDIKGRKMDRGENYMMMNFIVCILHRIFLW